jgi:hypothetical protein
VVRSSSTFVHRIGDGGSEVRQWLARRGGAADHRASLGARDTLLDALATCLAKAYACDGHCALELAQGHYAVARCAAAIADVLVVGESVRRLVSRGAPHSKTVVETFAAICKECSAACREHEAYWAYGIYLECKACKHACDACVAACETFITV